MFLDQLWSHTDNVLALPILDHVEGLQSADNILLSEAGQHAVHAVNN